MDRGAWWDAVPGVTELDATEHIHTNTNYRSSIKVCIGKIKKKKKKEWSRPSGRTQYLSLEILVGLMGCRIVFVCLLE